MRPSAIRATFLTVETETAVDISELSFYSNEAGSIRARGPGPSWAIRGLGPGARSPGPGARAIPGRGPGARAGGPGLIGAPGHPKHPQKAPNAPKATKAPNALTQSKKKPKAPKAPKAPRK